MATRRKKTGRKQKPRSAAGATSRTASTIPSATPPEPVPLAIPTPLAPVGVSCSNCTHWQIDSNDSNKGTCHHNAPVGQAHSNFWTVTIASDWCADHTTVPVGATAPPPLPVVSGIASAPAGTTSTTEVMQGLGLLTNFSITPVQTGRIIAMITGCCANSATSGGLNITGHHGTGTAPANGTPATGAVWSTTQHYFMTSARDVAGFTVIGGNPGLALNVPVWWDVSIAATGGGTATITDVQCLLWEL